MVIKIRALELRLPGIEMKFDYLTAVRSLACCLTSLCLQNAAKHSLCVILYCIVERTLNEIYFLNEHLTCALHYH